MGNTTGGWVPTGPGTLTGTYQWLATFSGDANNTEITSNTGNEPLSLHDALPIFKTVPGGTVQLGSGAALTDQAKLSGGSNYQAGDRIRLNLCQTANTSSASSL